MKRLYSFGPVELAGVLTVCASAQSWQQDPYYRDDPRSRGGYSQQGVTAMAMVVTNSSYTALMSDLDQAARRARSTAMRSTTSTKSPGSLQEFQARWARGKFDSGKLDKAIHNLEHLADADRVRGRDRETLSRDLYDLRQFSR